jgi:hypothetical protein
VQIEIQQAMHKNSADVERGRERHRPWETTVVGERSPLYQQYVYLKVGFSLPLEMRLPEWSQTTERICSKTNINRAFAHSLLLFLCPVPFS